MVWWKLKSKVFFFLWEFGCGCAEMTLLFLFSILISQFSLRKKVLFDKWSLFLCIVWDNFVLSNLFPEMGWHLVWSKWKCEFVLSLLLHNSFFGFFVFQNTDEFYYYQSWNSSFCERNFPRRKNWDHSM